MDAFAVAVSSGIIIKDNQLKNGIKIGLLFGGFQALMPLLGWAAGLRFSEYITNYDHWVAFILLSIIGYKMIYDSLKDEENKSFNPLDNKVLILLAIATSIDALAVGVSFAFLKAAIVPAVATIGVITFSLSFIGVLIGDKSGRFLKKHAGIAGGIVLALIGLKILLEHLEIM